jgi:8-oxo-dGTP pyrophosphatase MutT (NUDIX family)
MTKSLHLSDQFVISCGSVALDLQNSKVLVIHWRKTGEYFLAKGRKDIGESLEEAAIRETFEETGYTVKLLPLPIPTLATIPSGISSPSHVIEPVAVTQRNTNGKQKIIFWYAAQGDSNAIPALNTQQENEDFDSMWISFDSVNETLSFDDDKQMVSRVIDAARRMLPAI